MARPPGDPHGAVQQLAVLGERLRCAEQARVAGGVVGDADVPGVDVAVQEDETSVSLTPRRLIGWEIFVVFAVSLGASGVRALVELIGSLTAPQALSTQQALLVGTLAPGRPWLDLALQLVSLAQGLAPVALVWYLLARSGEGLSDIGVDDEVNGKGVGSVVFQVYGDGKLINDCPMTVVLAILLLVSHFYNNRDASSEAVLNTIPLGVAELIAGEVFETVN